MSKERLFLNQTPRLVLIAGATSASGIACARALTEAGAQVLAVGSNQTRLDERLAFTQARYECDLTDFAAVEALARRIHEDHGPIDSLIHLVGGWRGGDDGRRSYGRLFLGGNGLHGRSSSGFRRGSRFGWFFDRDW